MLTAPVACLRQQEREQSKAARELLQQSTHLQPVQEELPQQVLPKGRRLVQKATAHHVPVLAYGLAREQLPDRIADPREAFQALHVDQQVADPSPDIIAAPAGNVVLQTCSDTAPQNPGENVLRRGGGIVDLSVGGLTCRSTCRAKCISNSQPGSHTLHPSREATCPALGIKGCSGCQSQEHPRNTPAMLIAPHCKPALAGRGSGKGCWRNIPWPACSPWGGCS